MYHVSANILIPLLSLESFRVSLHLPTCLVSSLSSEQRYMREHGCDNIIFYENSNDNSPTRAGTKVLHELFLNLSAQWNVSVSLLIYNYELMVSSMLHLSLQDFVDSASTLELTIEEWKLALEIFMQMDVDCFYWKTQTTTSTCLLITSAGD
jgi:hypothetical protein